jgi:hypothetical protein
MSLTLGRKWFIGYKNPVLPANYARICGLVTFSHIGLKPLVLIDGAFDGA